MATAAPFTLDEDHQSFRESVRTLARSRYADTMLERSQSDKFPIAEFAELGAAGLLGLQISEAAGGQEEAEHNVCDGDGEEGERSSAAPRPEGFTAAASISVTACALRNSRRCVSNSSRLRPRQANTANGSSSNARASA